MTDTIEQDVTTSADEPAVVVRRSASRPLQMDGAWYAPSRDVATIRRRARTADRVTGGAVGAIVVAVIGASASLAHATSSASRLMWCGIWAATILVAVLVERVVRRPSIGISRPPARPGRRRRRITFAATVGGGAVVSTAVLLTSGWAVFDLLPGLFAATAIAVARHHRVRLRPRRARGWALLALGIVALVPLFSLELDLTAEGPDPLTIRTVEWMRDNGLPSIVDAAENWWYTRNPPPVGGTPSTLPPTPSTVPVETTETTIVPNQPTVPPQPEVVMLPVPTPAATPLPGEGQWAITAGTQSRPAVATTFVRPDAIHTSVVVGIMYIDPSVTRLRLVAGTQEPGGPAPHQGAVPLEDRSTLVAAFNSGFRMKDSRGGWYSEGSNPVPIRDGAASLVFRDDGRADVGVWGREVGLDPHVTAIRQNLALLVDNGQLVPGTDDANSGRWGGTVGNKVMVNRSGIGVTRDGALVYVGGPALSVATLGRTLIAAGAVRAMELDINYAWVNAFTYAPGPNGPVGTKLIEALPYGPERYLRPQGRDFVSITLAPPKA